MLFWKNFYTQYCYWFLIFHVLHNNAQFILVFWNLDHCRLQKKSLVTKNLFPSFLFSYLPCFLTSLFLFVTRWISLLPFSTMFYNNIQYQNTKLAFLTQSFNWWKKWWGFNPFYSYNLNKNGSWWSFCLTGAKTTAILNAGISFGFSFAGVGFQWRCIRLWSEGISEPGTWFIGISKGTTCLSSNLIFYISSLLKTLFSVSLVVPDIFFSLHFSRIFETILATYP